MGELKNMNERITCFQCGKKLQKHPSTGDLVFAKVLTRYDGVQRVHKVCQQDAEREHGTGYRVDIKDVPVGGFPPHE